MRGPNNWSIYTPIIAALSLASIVIILIIILVPSDRELLDKAKAHWNSWKQIHLEDDAKTSCKTYGAQITCTISKPKLPMQQVFCSYRGCELE